MNDIRQSASQLGLFVINGMVATVLHYAVFFLCLSLLAVQSPGLCFFVGSILGTVASFLGNRFVVFATNEGKVLPQFAKFVLTYMAISLCVSFIVDRCSTETDLSSPIIFLIGVAIQVSLSFLISKWLIFSPR